MPIKKESLLAIADLLKIDKKIFEDAMASDAETEIKLPEDISVFTKAELTSREEQIKSSSLRAGKEMSIKELKEKAGLEYDGQGSKDPARFLEEYGKKVLKDANITETEKIKELNTTIEGLRANITMLTSEKESMLKATKEAQLDNDILTMTIDKKPDNLTNKEWLAILKIGNEIVDHEGQTVVKRDGKIVVNKTDLKPIPVKDALIGYIDERKLGKQEAQGAAGRNGKDSKTPLAGISNLKQFNQHLAENGINANGEQARQMLKEITDSNPNFDFSNK
jgi:hypothetical protein